MMSLSHNLGNVLHKSQEKINHLMYMDEIKLFAKIKKNKKS